LELDGAPGPAEVRDFSRQLRQSLNLFEQPDVPDTLRQEASDLEDWASELPASLEIWESLRAQRGAAQAVRAACNALDDKREPLLKQMKAMAALAPKPVTIDYASAVAAIPSRKAMEIVQLKLPALVREADQILQGLHERVKELQSESPPVPVREDTPLYAQLLEELSAEAAASDAAREAATQAMNSVEPLLTAARAEAAAIQQIGLWREYLDLFTTGRVLGQKLAELGAAGIQACFIENASGVFGPFQLDEPVDLGSRRLAVRSTARNRLRLIDVPTTEVIGKSDNGSLVVDLAPPKSGGNDLNTFRLTGRWEDLAVQFDFLVRQGGQAIVKLTAPPPKTQSQSWTGYVLSALATDPAQRAAREQHQKESVKWRSYLQDLQALGPVKARIETWNFIQRIGEAIPKFLAKLQEHRAALGKSEKDLASIIARCKRDLDTDRLIIPPNLVQPYSEQTRLRDTSQREIARLEKLLVQLGSQVARQMASGAVVGNAVVPLLLLIPPFPPELEELIGQMNDEALHEQVSGLEQLLKMPLLGGGWQPSANASVRPAEPRRASPQPAPEQPPHDESEGSASRVEYASPEASEEAAEAAQEGFAAEEFEPTEEGESDHISM
ncbi:MAG TPA: hypothetical protein VLJ39_04555, partial [Tepidisphaeraceae bacterium]|nr:hypothetical protein [Tepidisphaeraceae bacterium]